MDIIIRNQFKDNILHCHHIGYVREMGGERHPDTHLIVGNYEISRVDNRLLGIYNTKERCIEIINDIYNQITQAVERGDSVVIYSMPKE